jgi:FtsP/CotA-like multicopper oxidase with cupredoxin domain
MSRNQRIGLLLAALAVAVVAVVVAVASGGGDDEGSQAAQPAQETTETGSGADTGTDTTEQPHETVPPEPPVTRIRLQAGRVAGGPADIKVTKGDTVRIVVSADAHDDIHLHGYDIEKPVEPGQPARFKFNANIEGIFELESHVAEDAGRNPLVGKLTVEPS